MHLGKWKNPVKKILMFIICCEEIYWQVGVGSYCPSQELSNPCISYFFITHPSQQCVVKIRSCLSQRQTEPVVEDNKKCKLSSMGFMKEPIWDYMVMPWMHSRSPWNYVVMPWICWEELLLVKDRRNTSCGDCGIEPPYVKKITPILLSLIDWEK